MKRPYRSPLREEQETATRRRVVDAMLAEMAAAGAPGDVDGISFAAVAERARVSERTVYRAFPRKREMVAAAIDLLEERAGLSDPRVPEDVPRIAERLGRLEELGFFRRPAREGDAALEANRARRYGALRDALAPVTAGLPPDQERAVCGVVQTLLSVDTLQRIVERWNATPQDASAAMGWAARALIGDLQEGVDRERRHHADGGSGGGLGSAPDPLGDAALH